MTPNVLRITCAPCAFSAAERSGASGMRLLGTAQPPTAVSGSTTSPIGQCLQEGDDRRLLHRCQTEVAHFAGHVGCVLGCGPAGAGYVAGVVKVNDVLKALEVAIVAISLHEAGVRPLVDIA